MKICKRHRKLFCCECSYGKSQENYTYKRDDLTTDFKRRDRTAWGKAINEIKNMRNED